MAIPQTVGSENHWEGPHSTELHPLLRETERTDRRSTDGLGGDWAVDFNPPIAEYFQPAARHAQRNFAAVERGFAFRSAGVGRMTSSAMVAKTPVRRPAMNAFFTRRSSPE